MCEQHPADGSAVERMAEVMAWHGMARYADPDDLAAYLRRDPPTEKPSPSHA